LEQVYSFFGVFVYAKFVLQMPNSSAYIECSIVVEQNI